MSRANYFTNKAFNETVVKFEIDTQTKIYPETFIILDIVSARKPHYSYIRSELFKNIIPNLNLEIKTGIHFIYNEQNEAKYFRGNLYDFKNLNIKDDSYLNNSNFPKIAQKLESILNTIDKEKYINILTIVNYGTNDTKINKNENNSLFEKMKNKFKNVDSQILFLGSESSFNSDYLSFTQYSKGYSKKFIFSLPIFAKLYDNKTNYKDLSVIKNLIKNKDIKVMNFIKFYLEKNALKEEEKNVEKMHKNWAKEFLKKPYDIIDDYINNFDNHYQIAFKTFIKNNEKDIEKIEKLEEECRYNCYWLYRFLNFKFYQAYFYNGKEQYKKRLNFFNFDSYTKIIKFKETEVVGQIPNYKDILFSNTDLNTLIDNFYSGKEKIDAFGTCNFLDFVRNILNSKFYEPGAEFDVINDINLWIKKLFNISYDDYKKGVCSEKIQSVRTKINNCIEEKIKLRKGLVLELERDLKYATKQRDDYYDEFTKNKCNKDLYEKYYEKYNEKNEKINKYNILIENNKDIIEFYKKFDLDKFLNKIEEYKTCYLEFKNKQENLYRTKYNKFFSNINKLQNIIDNNEINFFTYDKNYTFKEKFKYIGSSDNYKHFNFSRFPYSQITKCSLIELIMFNVLYEVKTKKPINQFQFKYDFGIDFDVCLNALDEIGKYSNEMIKQKDGRFIIMEKLQSNDIFDLNLLYNKIPKFFHPYSDVQYENFKKELLIKSDKYSKEIKVIIFLSIVYNMNKGFLSKYIKESTVEPIEKLFYIISYNHLNEYSSNQRPFNLVYKNVIDNNYTIIYVFYQYLKLVYNNINIIINNKNLITFDDFINREEPIFPHGFKFSAYNEKNEKVVISVDEFGIYKKIYNNDYTKYNGKAKERFILQKKEIYVEKEISHEKLKLTEGSSEEEYTVVRYNFRDVIKNYKYEIIQTFLDYGKFYDIIYKNNIDYINKMSKENKEDKKLNLSLKNINEINSIFNINITTDDVIQVLFKDQKLYNNYHKRYSLVKEMLDKDDNCEERKEYKSLIKDIKENYKKNKNLSYQEIIQKIKDKRYFGLFHCECESYWKNDNYFSFRPPQFSLNAFSSLLHHALEIGKKEKEEFELNKFTLHDQFTLNVDGRGRRINEAESKWHKSLKIREDLFRELHLEHLENRIILIKTKNYDELENYGELENILDPCYHFLSDKNSIYDINYFISRWIMATSYLNYYRETYKRPSEKIDDYISFHNFSKFYEYTRYYYDEDVNEYRIYYGGKIDADLYLETIDYECANEIKQKIELLYNNLKRIIVSGWKIVSKNGRGFRIEPFGEKYQEIQLPIGESTLYVEGIYKSLNDAIGFLYNNSNNNMEINNKGNVTKDNLKKVYEDSFKMIMSRIINNSVFNKEEGKQLNLDLIKYIDDLENKIEGFANKDSKKLSQLLRDLNNDEQLKSLNTKDITYILNSKINQFQKEINLLIEEELKSKEKNTKPEFILLLDISENLKNHYQNFVHKILYEVLIKLGFKEKDKINIYTFNQEGSTNISTSVKNLKKFKCECEGCIHFKETLKDCLEEICDNNDQRYYLLSLFSGKICDKDEIRSIAFKSIGLSSKIFIKSRVIRFITEKSNFENDEITYGLLQQISTGDLIVYEPIAINYNDSDDTQIQKIADAFGK